MFNNNTEERFYVFIRSKNKTVYLGDRKALIRAASAHANSHYFWTNTSKEAEMYKNIDFSGSDTTVSFRTESRKVSENEVCYDTYKDVVLKDYVFFDEQNRIINVRDFHKEIMKYRNRVNKNEYHGEKKNGNCLPGDVCNIYASKQTYKYRRGPVPFVHKRHYYHALFRRPRRMNYIKAATDVEYGKYVKQDKTSTTLPIWCDDNPIKNRDTSWKSNSKCRHQWQKNLK